ncbi:hypothetical protein pb186bvf_008112 [Paramecium bursaria]
MFLQILSSIIGWTYFISWSLSFYPQVIQNYVLKQVEGLSIDYVSMNISGYIFLSTYSTAGYLDSSWEIGQVNIEDLAFAYHGLLLTSIEIIQMIIYPIGKNKLSKIIITILIIMWSYTIVYTLATLVFNLFTPEIYLNAYKIMGYNKILITLIKYVPQILWNFARKTTKGWSIYATILDIIGGVLSFGQTILDLYIPDLDANINLVKLSLGVISLGFDVILLIQHYILYPEKKNGTDYTKVEDPVNTSNG